MRSIRIVLAYIVNVLLNRSVAIYDIMEPRYTGDGKPSPTNHFPTL
jgi:hypothetical protein